ncbi:MAG TPA: hypothetical protein VNS32_09250 [Flavisolibacter sp.]|nr:hypothetical protein [Flavisolibacter sp.]
MELRKENTIEKRRRKLVTRPVLVRSVKQGQVLSATYSREQSTSSAPFWKA